MVEKWPRVEQWINVADNKRDLAEVLLTRCYRTNETVIGDGGGCDCPPHRAFRTEAAETAADVRLKREMQVVAQLALVQDSLREVTIRAQGAEQAKKAADDARDKAVRAAGDASAVAEAASAEVRTTRQRVADVENKFAAFKDQEAFMKSLLAKIAAAQKALD